MTFNYRVGLFRIWLVFSLFWMIVALVEEFAWGQAIGVPLGLGVVRYLIVETIRGFVVKPPAPMQTFDLRDFRQDIQAETPDGYKTIEPILDFLEAKYGNNVPLTEMDNLRQLNNSKLANIQERIQDGVNQAAAEGKTIEIESLRRTFERSKAAYAGPDRECYVMEMDKFLESIIAKYGNRIPMEDAYKIMKDFEADVRDTSKE